MKNIVLALILFGLGFGLGWGINYINQEEGNSSSDTQYNDASDQGKTENNPKDSEFKKNTDIPSQEEMNDKLGMDKAREDGEMFYSKDLGVAFSYGVKEFNRGYSTIEVVEDGNGLNVVSLPEDKDIDEIDRFSGHRLEVFDKPTDQSVETFLEERFLSEEYPDCVIEKLDDTNFFPEQIHREEQQQYSITAKGWGGLLDEDSKYDDPTEACPEETQPYVISGTFMQPYNQPDVMMYLRIAAGTGIDLTADDGMPGEENGEWFDTLQVF